jgi:alpha-N-arabinofuranosidase
VITALRDHIDYLSLHHYSGNYEKDHNKFMAISTRVDRIITTTEGLINEVRDRYKVDHPIYIAFDEYNVWYRAFTEQKLEEHYNMEDALVVAMYLNTFIRHANSVKMANMAQLVNVIAPMMVTNDKLWLQTIYHPLALFAARCKGRAVNALVQCDTYDAGDYKKVPWLDVSVVHDAASKQLVVNVVNRSADKAIPSTIENQWGNLGTSATVTEVNSASLTDENSVNEQKVRPVERSIAVKGNTIPYTFPAHSFTQLIIKTAF